MAKGRDNRRYTLQKMYDLKSTEDMLELNYNIIRLTKKSARLSIITGQKKVKLYIFCRTNTSKAYKEAVKIGFKEF